MQSSSNIPLEFNAFFHNAKSVPILLSDVLQSQVLDKGSGDDGDDPLSVTDLLLLDIFADASQTRCSIKSRMT